MLQPKQAHKKPIISKTPDSIGNPQVNWDVKKFEDLIFDKGYKSHIERALRCPCIGEANGQANPDCKNCSGTGWAFIEKSETTLICTSMSNRSKYENWSETNMGMVNISSRAEDKLGFMDKVTLIELESWFSQILRLKQSKSEVNKLFSFLVYDPIYVFNVYLFIDSESPLKSLDENEYEIKDNRIIFEKSVIQQYTSLPNPSISIRYTHNPSYHIIDINRDLIKQKTGIDCKTNEINKSLFPLNCIGRRAHYIPDSPDYNGNSVFDNTNYSKKTSYKR